MTYHKLSLVLSLLLAVRILPGCVAVEEAESITETSMAIQIESLEEFLDNAAIGTHRVNAEGVIDWASRRELSELGYSREEYVRHKIAEFHVDPETIEMFLTTLLAGGELHYEPARLRDAHGRIRYALVTSNGYRVDGKLVYTRCFTELITEPLYRLAKAQKRAPR